MQKIKNQFFVVSLASNDAIVRIFQDKFGREGITPRHESSIQVRLEKEYNPSQVRTVLKNLEKKGFIVSRKKAIEGVGNSTFYFPKKFDTIQFSKKIDEKIENSSYWIRRYSDEKIVKMIGDHLHDLVRAELRAHNFQIEAEGNVKEFEGKEWSESEHSLDIIAKHRTKELTIGVEIKNERYPTSKSEIITKIKMCEAFGIVPVFATRWLEMHRKVIEESGGLLWQFKKQFYPRGYEKFVEIIRKRFKIPVQVAGNLPPEAIREIEEWILKQ